MRLARKLASLCASGVSGVEGIGLADALFIAQGHDTWATLVVPDTRWKAHVEAAAGPMAADHAATREGSGSRDRGRLMTLAVYARRLRRER